MLDQTLTEQAAALRRGDYSATELTAAYLARIGARNAALNAFVTVTAEAAAQAAAAADASLAGGDAGAALACWQKSADAAAAMAMPLDEALAWLEISRHGAGTHATLAHARAAALFEQLGVTEPAPAYPPLD